MRKNARSVVVPATSPEPAAALPDAPREFRYRCGHAEPERTATQRMRRHARAVWISCAGCNVITVAIMPPADEGQGEQTG